MTSPGFANDRFNRVRPYAITGGRTRSRVPLEIESIVLLTELGHARLTAATNERRRILAMCDQPMSIAEISAHLGVVIGAIRVLVGDLIAEGMLESRNGATNNNRPDVSLLERVLDGLKAL